MEELEQIGVDVWMAGTIYVQAKDEDEAAAIVQERYAGGRDNPDILDLGDRETPLEGDDTLSPAFTLYGLASESKLVAEADPVRDAAPDMLKEIKAALELLDNVTAHTDNDSDFLGQAENALQRAVWKSEGGAVSEPSVFVTAQSLEARYGRWQDHPDYSDRDWRNDETRLGYWEWVASKVNGAEGGAE